MSLFNAYSHVTVLGRMTRDAELRTTPSGKRVADVTVAIDAPVKDGETTFVDCTLWEKTAELAERFGGKGKVVLISGEIVTESWTDKSSGQKRSKLKVVGRSITFCGGKEGGSDSEPPRQQPRGQSRGRDDDEGVPF
jgi:single-strand DNA-binding protein